MKNKWMTIAAVMGVSLAVQAAEPANFAHIREEAKAEHKLILLRFSGSDWCLPCIRMEKQVLEQPVFKEYAVDHLKIVNADFPRQSKHKPDKATEAQNETLAELYNKEGHFPYMLLLNADGKVLKTWDGYTGEKPEAFIHDMESVTHQ